VATLAAVESTLTEQEETIMALTISKTRVILWWLSWAQLQHRVKPLYIATLATMMLEMSF
jgi:hypothetical protein